MSAQHCLYCGRDDRPIHIDHVVPRSRGGPDTPANLAAACDECNLSKHTRLPSEWLSMVPPWIEAIEESVTAALEHSIGARRDRKRRPAPPPPPTLVGKFFHSWRKGADGHDEIVWQGHVLHEDSPGLYLVQLLSWFGGDPIEQKLLAVSQMAAFTFYDDAETLRHRYEDYHRRKSGRSAGDRP